MNTYVKLPKQQLYWILITCAVLIFFPSIEAFMRVKDYDLFLAWVNEVGGSPEDLFDTYITIQLNIYFISILLPMVYGIYSYFAYTKIRINQLFVFMWGVLIIVGFAYTIVNTSIESIFFFGYIFGYALLFMTNLSLAQVIQESKSV